MTFAYNACLVYSLELQYMYLYGLVYASYCMVRLFSQLFSFFLISLLMIDDMCVYILLLFYIVSAFLCEINVIIIIIMY